MNTAKQILHNEIANGKSPGVAYAFFNKDTILFRQGEGLADVLNHKEINAGSTFNGFSVTKTFTALAILQLEEKGLIKLSDPVIKYLPQFVYGKDITIQHLLNHTSGIPNPIPLKWAHLIEEHDSFNRDAYFNPVFEKNNKLKSQPGARFKYTNLGYIILGQVIEQVTGESYEAYITGHILNNVAAPDALGFTINPGYHAKGYQKKNSLMNLMLTLLIDKKKFMDVSEGTWKPFKHIYMNGAPYGGLIISIDGMVRYGQAILNNKLISSESRKKFFTENITGDGKPTGMCLSWFTDTLHGQRYFHHAGGGGGYYTEFRLYPDINSGSVLIFNRSGMKDERLLDKLDADFIKQKTNLLTAR